MITVTEKAYKAIKNLLSKEENKNYNGIRIKIIGGGCSGLMYDLSFENKRDEEKDIEISENDCKVYIDMKSALYLFGTTLDYDDGLNGRGFLFSNPNAKSQCGCSESFSV